MTEAKTSTRTSSGADQPKNKPARSKQPISKANLTRSVQLTRLLRRKTGASMAQVQATFGWQPHTVRAAISAQRKAGHRVERTSSDTGPVYRIVTDEAKP